MPRMRTLLLFAVVALAGCPRTSENYCDENNRDCGPNAYCNTDLRICVEGSAPDAAIPCQSNDDCTTALPYCDGSECKACGPNPGDPSACPATAPVCTDEFACRPCGTDLDCASDVCLADGACADESTTRYVAVGASGACTKTDPCGLDTALLMLVGPEDVRTIELAGGTYNRIDQTTINDSVTLTGRGATLHYADTLPASVIAISAPGITVRIDFLTLENAVGSGDGVTCGSAAVELRQVTLQGNAGYGLEANTCSVLVSRSTIANNGAGISVEDGAFDITNNMIHSNRSTAMTGGVSIESISVGTPQPRRLEFNTIANNDAVGGTPSGVTCSVISDPLTFRSNILYGNDTDFDTGTVGCTHEYSVIEEAMGGTTGPGVVSGDPMFVNAGGGNFAITSGSSARGVAAPDATMAFDFQGEPRPQPVGGTPDSGADEIP